MWRIKLRDERGAAAVEFALVFPLLALMLYGIVEVGTMYNAQITVTSAARDAARTMAIDNDSAAARAAAVAASGSVAVTSSEVAISPTTCTAGSTIAVTITHTQHLITGLFGATVPLTGKATRRCNG